MAQTRVIALVAVLLALLLGGCGSSKDSSDPGPVGFANDKDTEAGSSKADEIEGNVPYTTSDKFKEKFNNDSGTETRTACSLLSKNRIAELVADQTGKAPPELEVHGTRSLDLSFCEYRTDDIYLKLTLDTAPQTVIRYFNQITEARQLPNLKLSSGGARKLRVQAMRDIGDDSTYGGSGAFWEPSRNDLEAIKDKRIVGVVANLDGLGSVGRKRLSGELAVAMFDKLGRAAQ